MSGRFCRIRGGVSIVSSAVCRNRADVESDGKLKRGSSLHVKAATVRQYARAGRVPFDVTPGGHRRFDVDEVVQAMSSEDRQMQSNQGSASGVDSYRGTDTPYVRIPREVVGSFTTETSVTQARPLHVHASQEEDMLWGSEMTVE